MLLDGGKSSRCESTVAGSYWHVPLVVAPGVTVEMLESIVGQVNIHPNVMKPLQEGQSTFSRYEIYKDKNQSPVTLIRVICKDKSVY